MSVSNTHDAYKRQQYLWRRCRDVVEGRDALLRDAIYRNRTNVTGTLFADTYFGGRNNYLYEEYIPRLTNQSENEYYRYVERASFFNATQRTVDALTGLLFAKPPTKRLPDLIGEYADDITMSGCTLREFTSQVAREEITTSRVGILVDYPDVDTSELTVADVQRMNLRPYLTMYKAEHMINWVCGMVNGVKQLTMVVLAEQIDVQKNEFQSDREMRFRVLDLQDGVYRVRVMDDKGDLISEQIPQMNGTTLDYIPFTIVGGYDLKKPLIMDLVDTNISHYRNSADYENGLHFTGLPTPYVSGVQLSEGQTLQIGSTAAWVFPDPAAKASYLEFTGNGLQTLADAMKDKEHRMAVLGARMLTDEKKSAEASSTVELRTAGERSVLADVAFDISDAMEKALTWLSEWAGVDASQMEYQLNIDFGAHRMQPQMLAQLMQAVQGDLMPMSVFFDNLKRGEIVGGTMDFEEYENEISTQNPSVANDFQASENGNILESLRGRLGL